MMSAERDFDLGGRKQRRAEDVERSIASRNEPRLLTPDDVLRLDEKYRVSGGRKMIFGETILSLVKRDFAFTRDMYRTTTFTPVALAAAEALLNICEFISQTEEDVGGRRVFKGVEGCGGAGSQTWALAVVGNGEKLWIDATIDNDNFVQLATKRNFQLLGLKLRDIQWSTADVITFLRNQAVINNGNGWSHEWFMGDPDWYGKHYREENDEFRFSDMHPDGNEMVRAALKIAPIVTIKAPGLMQDSEIRRLAEDVGAYVYVLDTHLTVGGREPVKERLVYFIDERFFDFSQKEDRIFLNEEVSLELGA